MTQTELHDLEAFARLVRGDPWAAGDYLAQRFPVDQYPATTAKSGLHGELERFAAEIERCTGVSVKAPALRQYRATALAWPHEVRSSCAAYKPHEMLRGKADRVEQLDRYVKRAQAEGAERLTHRHLRRYLSEGQPQRTAPEPPSLLDALDKAARRFLRFERGVIAERADWWNVDRLTDIERAELADWCEATAKSIRG